VVIELYRVKCPDCGLKAEKAPQLPSKALVGSLLIVGLFVAVKKRVAGSLSA
jgi:hypothetical protein